MSTTVAVVVVDVPAAPASPPSNLASMVQRQDAARNAAVEVSRAVNIPAVITSSTAALPPTYRSSHSKRSIRVLAKSASTILSSATSARSHGTIRCQRKL